jgi:hypothetical protein
MTPGGKRKGSGRPRADTVNYWLKLRTQTAQRLRARVPVGERSKFVSDLIDNALVSPGFKEWEKDLLDENRQQS